MASLDAPCEPVKDSLCTPLLSDSLSHAKGLEYSVSGSKALERKEFRPSNATGPMNQQSSKSSAASAESKSSLLVLPMREYTGDGSVDSRGRPSMKSETGGWATCPFILGNECCERLAFYGINSNLVNYMTRILLQGNAAAAKNVAIWCGTGYMTPLFGAFIADAYLGRYKTISTFSMVYLVGLILLTVSASVPSLRPPPCLEEIYPCRHASPSQLGLFYSSLYLVALGMGGIKSCVSSFGADQFDDEDRSERKKKTHFFNWFYLSINIGSLIAASLLVYIQDNVSWGLGYGIPAMFMIVALSTFFLGAPLYRYQKPRGSPFTRIAQVLVAAACKRYTRLPSDERALYGFYDKDSTIQGTRIIEHTKQFSFLDKAAVLTGEEAEMGLISSSPWQLCPVSQVEEVKTILRLVPIWVTTIFFSTVYAQMSTLFLEQGLRMDNRLGDHFRVPPASLSMTEILTVIVFVPIYDRFLVKFVRRFTGHQQGFTQLRRMGIGLCISVLSMLVASAVEVKRIEAAKIHGLITDPIRQVPMSIFWQVPQYFLIGVAETFTYIGQLEFFYEQVPDGMRSLGTALAIATFGLGYYVSSLLIVIVTHFTRGNNSPGWIPDNLNLGHLDYFFDLLAFLSCINFVCYLLAACCFKYKKTKRAVPSTDLK